MDSDQNILQSVPEPYHKFLYIFSKRWADTLPSHCAYDCQIKLLPGAEIPFGRIFLLSEREQEALKEYINGNLEMGFICPSTSPAGAGIFFVTNKYQSFLPCVNYR